MENSSKYGYKSYIYTSFYIIFAQTIIYLWQKDINRIKVVLVEKKRTNKWLAEALQKRPCYCFKMVCTNVSQPSIETLVEIARVLEVDVKDLLVSTTNDSVYIKIPKV